MRFDTSVATTRMHHCGGRFGWVVSLVKCQCSQSQEQGLAEETLNIVVYSSTSNLRLGWLWAVTL